MTQSRLVDRIDRLPLPLAQLVVRAQNAKSAAERHYLAWSLAEATLKLCAFTRIAIWVKAGPRPGKVASLLPHIVRPKTGGWVAIVRAVDADLGQRARATSLPLGRLHGRLESEHSWPAVDALVAAALAENVISNVEAEEARVHGLAGFFGLIPAYRKNTLKVGQPPNAFCDRFSELWLAALDEVLGSRELWGDGALMVRGAVNWLELRGLGALPGAAPSRGASSVSVGELALRIDDVAIPLMPLAVYVDADEGLGEKVLLLNGAAVKGKAKGSDAAGVIRSVEYLDYVSGESEKIDTRSQLENFLVTIHGASLTSGELGELASGPKSGTPLDGTSPIDPGALVGDYEIIDELGRGGMGVVYRARQLSTRRIVALKVLPPVLADDAEAVARFEREVRALARCDHPNVVKVYGAHLDAESPHYAMEFVDGADLAGVAKVLTSWRSSTGRLKDGHVASAAQAARSRRSMSPSQPSAGMGGVAATPPAADGRADTIPPAEELLPRTGNFYREIAGLFAGAADGLAELHKQGVLHRDVKPGNLMLTADGKRLVIMDLGLAWLADATRQLTMTQSGGMGTLRYMPPEQLDRKLAGPDGKLDVRADVYSLGVSLYEFAVGRTMFSGPTEMDVTRKVLEEKPAAPSQLDRHLPKGLSDIIEVATSKSAEDRYGSAAEFAEDLRRFAEQGTSKAKPKTRLQRALRWARQRPLRVAAAAAAVVGLAFAADYGWAYATGETEYCAAMTWHWGVPECVGEVSTSVAAKRYATYRFEYLHRRVVNVTRVNGSGSVNPTSRRSVTSWVPEYNDAGDVVFVDLLDRNSVRVERRGYEVLDEQHWNVWFLDRGLRPNRQHATAVVGAHWAFDDDGRVERLQWLNLDGEPHPMEGVYGERREWNADGLMTLREYLGPDNETPRAMRHSVAFFTKQYDSRGELVDIAGFNVAGTPGYDDDKTHRSEYIRDEYGNAVEVRNYDAEGKLAYLDVGYARVERVYTNGNLVEEAYFGQEDNLAYSEKTGAARIKQSHDPSGNVALIEYFDGNGKPLLGKAACARLQRKWDTRGNKVEQRCFGVGGERILGASSCWRRAWTRDARTGDDLREDCFDADDAPSLRDDLCATALAEYDESGEMREFECRGVDGEPVLNRRGMWKTEHSYDARGYLMSSTNRGLDGRAIPNARGITTYRWRYDRHGNLLRTDFLDSNGRAVPTTLGYSAFEIEWYPDGTKSQEIGYGIDGKPTAGGTGSHGQRYRYDPRGNLIEWQSFDQDGNPMLTKWGATAEIHHDRRDRIVGVKFLGLNGEPIVNGQGFSREERTWDARSNPTGSTYFGADDQRAVIKGGWSRVARRYDSRGRKIDTRYFGAKNEPVLSTWAHHVQTEWDERNNIRARRYFGTRGEPILEQRGIASYAKKYDERQNVTDERYFGLDGEPSVLSEGWARKTALYDARGNPTEIRYFGTDGPGLHNDGFHFTTQEWDARGNKLKQAYFGIDEKPTLDKRGIHRVEMVYDERRQQTGWAAFGINGEPVEHKDGYGPYTAAYDAFGNQTTQTFYTLGRRLDHPVARDARNDTKEVRQVAIRETVKSDPTRRHADGVNLCNREGRILSPAHFGHVWKPTADKRGIARIEREFDPLGNLLTEAYCGTDGQPVLDDRSVARATMTYDYRGKRLSERFYGRDGKPTRNKDGYAGSDSKWNGQGFLVRHTYLGVDGKPILISSAGYATYEAEYNNQGFKTEEAFFGTDGKTLIADKRGAARVRMVHSPTGKVIQESYSGVNDRPVRVKDGYAIRRAAYNPRGELTEESFFGVDDQPTKNRQGVHRVKLAVDQRGNVTKREYFDTSGNPTRHNKDRYSCATFTYDEHDKETSQKPCPQESTATKAGDKK